MIDKQMTTTSTGINWSDIGVITAIVVALVTAAAFAVTRIFKLGKVAQRLETLEKDVKAVKKDIGATGSAITKRIDDLHTMLAQRGLSEAHSPRQLNETGQKVLKSSGIGDVVDDKYDLIVKKVKEKDPKNPYQAEQAVLEVVNSFAENSTLKDAIEEGAFNSGYSVTSVLFVGGLYIRDRVLKELGFNVDEIDKHTPKASE
jgi:hypothetical protein